mmetsp:Transcript_2908/g.6881  ORF Transcript_2908/g.6881 Transcript_2908/m.6881 type:complete len:222 (+) Transcript_2908:267-932(+)
MKASGSCCRAARHPEQSLMYGPCRQSDRPSARAWQVRRLNMSPRSGSLNASRSSRAAASTAVGTRPGTPVKLPVRRVCATCSRLSQSMPPWSSSSSSSSSFSASILSFLSCMVCSGSRLARSARVAAARAMRASAAVWLSGVFSGAAVWFCWSKTKMRMASAWRSAFRRAACSSSSRWSSLRSPIASKATFPTEKAAGAAPHWGRWEDSKMHVDRCRQAVS